MPVVIKRVPAPIINIGSILWSRRGHSLPVYPPLLGGASGKEDDRETSPHVVWMSGRIDRMEDGRWEVRCQGAGELETGGEIRGWTVDGKVKSKKVEK